MGGRKPRPVDADRVAPPTPPTLDEARDAAKAYVDFAIDVYRRKYITEIAGQQTVYNQKQAELSAFRLDTDDPVDSTKYDYMAAEAADAGVALDVVADVYEQMATATKTASIPSETLRTGTKRRINAAVDVGAVADLVAAFDAALAVTP